SAWLPTRVPRYSARGDRCVHRCLAPRAAHRHAVQEGHYMSGRQAIVIGAGVAGLAAAWWLHRIGWRVTVLERAAARRAAGYMTGVSGPGLEIARRMALIPKREAAACVVNENVYRDTRGRELLRLRYREFLKDLPYVAL